MLEEIQIVEKEYSTKVKAIITDAASDCRKARRLVVEQQPHILSLDCFAHQVHLMAATLHCWIMLLFLAVLCNACRDNRPEGFSLLICLVAAAADEFAGWQLSEA